MARIKLNLKINIKINFRSLLSKSKKKIKEALLYLETYYLAHFVTSTILVIGVVLIFLSYFWVNTVIALNKGSEIKITDQDVTNALHLVSQQKIDEARIAKIKREEAAKKEADIREWTAKVENYFRAYGSPLAGYGEIIVRKAVECGGNYKILIGIAGNESGLGKVPYKKYNPYGYLDGITYTGWNESLNKLSCVISQRFIAPCKEDLYCIIRKYAGPGDNQDLWVRNVSYFMAQV
ncbi:MAG: hypothetical protein ABIM99_00370 [Candidatus Dojkabacteria bacterium]